MKTIVILFALLCAACVAGEIMIVLADRNGEDDEEYEEDENNEKR